MLFVIYPKYFFSMNTNVKFSYVMYNSLKYEVSEQSFIFIDEIYF